MTTTSLVPEHWALVERGDQDPESGLPFAIVARRKLDVAERMTIWKLLKRPNGWYNVGQFISKGEFRTYPEKNGVKLSNSRIDSTLREFAEKGYALDV